VRSAEWLALRSALQAHTGESHPKFAVLRQIVRKHFADSAAAAAAGCAASAAASEAEAAAAAVAVVAVGDGGEVAAKARDTRVMVFASVRHIRVLYFLGGFWGVASKSVATCVWLVLGVVVFRMSVRQCFCFCF